MINAKDEVVQIISFGAEELLVHNRNIIEEDSGSLGYSKIRKKENFLENDEYGRLNTDLSPINYELKWKLLLDDDEILQLFKIISSYDYSVRALKKSSYYLYDSAAVLPVGESIILEDNRIKDFNTNAYEKYKINIVAVEGFSPFKISNIKNFYIVEFSAETLEICS